MGNNASSSSSSSSSHRHQGQQAHSAAAGHETKSAASSQRKEAKSLNPRHLNKTPTTANRSGATTTRSNNAVHFEHVTAETSAALGNSIPSNNKSHEPANTTKTFSPPQDIPSKPLPISAGTAGESTSARSHRSSLDNISIPPTQDMSYHLNRPPRLPLPIEEEVHTPGSPIIPPADSLGPPLELDASDQESPLARKGSQSSHTTVDEDDEDGELQLDKTRAVVPTLVEWVGGNQNSKVYVTGSIFSWNKKQRLHPDPNRPGVFSANVHVRPGTHHLNFLIDGVMTTSTHLPTTVDFNNHLVNYIEVSPDDIPKPPSTPTSATKPASTKPPPTPKMKPTIPLSSYTSEVPGYLDDLELPEESEGYQRVAAAIEKLPPPPSLPGFLGKPILNAATPMKDDNSVLVFPNHTVLNHLATSSIKNGVLAVSATTRYKKKYVTTIMYKPT